MSIKVTKLYICDIFGLSLRKIEALRKVRNNILLVLGVSYDSYRLIDIKEYCGKTNEKLLLVLFLRKLEGKLAREAGRAEFNPLKENIANTKLARRAVDKYIKSTVKGIFKLGCRKELFDNDLGVGILS